MATAVRKLAYKKRLDKLAREFDRLSDSAVKETLKHVFALSREIEQKMRAARGYTGVHLQELLRALNDTVDDFRKRYGDVVDAELAKQFEAGWRGVDATMRSAGLDLALPSLSRGILEVSRGFTADLITRVSEDIRALAASEIVKVATGIQTPFEAIKAVKLFVPDRTITRVDPATGEPYEQTVGAAWRAEMIVRTETNRIYSVATEARIQNLAQEIPDIRKEWQTSGDERVRESHKKLNGVRVRVGEKFPVDTGPALDYPRDPAGDASETINCFVTDRAPILTDQGWQPISRIMPGARVLTRENRFMRVQRILRRTIPVGTEYMSLTVSTHRDSHEPRRVPVTLEHRFMARNGWTRAIDLRKGTLVAVLARKCEICVTAPAPFWARVCSKRCWARLMSTVRTKLRGAAATASATAITTAVAATAAPTAYVGTLMMPVLEAKRLRTSHRTQVFNFAVEEDASYFAYGLLSSNCRCRHTIWHPAFDSDAPMEIATATAPLTGPVEDAELAAGIWRPRVAEERLAGQRFS